MHATVRVLALCVIMAGPAVAQQPDTIRRRTAADSVRADSAAQVADSIALMRELEAAMAAQPAATSAPVQGAGPSNPRMLPDVSAVGDLVADLSPDGSTQEDGTRFGIREIEVALQAAVDPFFRGDVFLGFNDTEGVAIEQAYLTATALPHGIEARLGRFLMPVGKQNTTHRHDLHTVEYPYVLQNFLGAEGLTGTGVYVSKVLAPFGFYQELLVTAVDRFGEREEGLTTSEPVNRELGGLGFSARLRNYWDLSQSTNLEIGASGMTGEREQPLDFAGGTPVPDVGINAVAARQSLVGADVTIRWRPLRQGLYKSFIFQGEVMHQINESSPDAPACLPDPGAPTPGCVAVDYAGPTRDVTGAYAFARYQLTRRLYLGGRYDWLQDPGGGDQPLMAGSGYLEWFPSEFSKLSMMYERLRPPGGVALNRILLQATFAVGPHKPHPF